MLDKRFSSLQPCVLDLTNLNLKLSISYKQKYLVAVELLPLLIIELDVEGFDVGGACEVDERVANVALILKEM